MRWWGGAGERVGTVRTSSRKARNQFSRCTHLRRKRLGKKHRVVVFEDSSLGVFFYLSFCHLQ